MGSRFWPVTSEFGLTPEALLTAVTMVVVVIMVATAWTAGPGLVLPVLSGVLLFPGFVLALIHRNDFARSPRLTFKDVGAALVFAGFAAALISDPSHLLPRATPNAAIVVR